MALLRSVATIGSFTMGSRILGFVRDTLFAAVLGAGVAADCFIIAFRLPNFLRAMFAEGAFNAAFVPLYSRLLSGPDGETRAAYFAGQIGTLLTLVVTCFVALVMVFTNEAMHVLAPGFTADPAKFALAVELTRLTFPYLAYISLVSLMGAILNAHHRFAAPAGTPIVMNLILIGALIGPARHFEPAHAQAVAVTIAGMAQFLWLAVSLQRAGLSLRLYRPRVSPEIRRFFTLLMPAVLGAGVYQVNVFVDMILSSLLPSGAVSFLFYADRLNQLPLGVIGIAVSTALLPILSRQLAKGDMEQALHSQNRALEGALLLTLPAAAALVTLPETIIGVLFQHGAFTAGDTRATADALAMFALGLPAFVATKVFTPGFHAREDTRTPVRLAIIAMIANLVVALSLLWSLEHVGLAIATTVAAWVNVGQLGLTSHRRGYFVPDTRLITRSLRLVLATAVMVVVLLGLEYLARPFFARDLLWRIGTLLFLVGSGGLAFLLAALATGAIGLADLKRLLRFG
ncbi:murein biosynthesis integral membrane protein MurJ [Oleomonas cavernae]|uniref:Probable lipid II flippase MurJ n=1 Tax=Oleomonas cavernae TaxID=2320859 RepID=A0A418WHR5_9PROT|nr:murein biosynthesis integral membrane protein MurJ [Oleomonas cavernae]RJF89538.1 murein biosynthesis integral membrane protein MurJ [Oleomonas cavernae]